MTCKKSYYSSTSVALWDQYYCMTIILHKRQTSDLCHSRWSWHQCSTVNLQHKQIWTNMSLPGQATHFPKTYVHFDYWSKNMYKLSTLRRVDYQEHCCYDSSIQAMLSLLNTAPLWILLTKSLCPPFWNPHFQTSIPHYGHSCQPYQFSQETPMVHCPLPSQGVTILLYFSQILTIFHTFLVISTGFWHYAVCSWLYWCIASSSVSKRWMENWREDRMFEQISH